MNHAHIPAFAMPRPRRIPGSYTDHEIVAALSGQVADCCGPPLARSMTTPRPYAAVCAIVRDELDLSEWVAYQFAVGFEHVFIFDNESVDPVISRLARWVADGKVTVVPIRGRRQQNHAYSALIRKTPARWIAFVDADEFVLPHGTDDIKTLLAEYEQYGGLGVVWQVFGSNGHIKRPSGLVIESYARRSTAPINTDPGSDQPWPRYKSIVQVDRALRCGNPHFVIYRPGCFAVNEQFDRLEPKPFAPPTVKKIQLNHYMSKSRADWTLKQTRCGGASGRPRTMREWDFIQRHFNETEDTRIQRFVPAVKALMERYA